MSHPRSLSLHESDGHSWVEERESWEHGVPGPAIVVLHVIKRLLTAEREEGEREGEDEGYGEVGGEGWMR